MEAHDFLVPLAGGLHIAHSLVVDHMVDFLEVGGRDDIVEGLS